MDMKTNAAAAGAPDPALAIGSALGDIWRQMAGMQVPASALTELQGQYLREATEIWNASLQRLQPESKAPAPVLQDRRFAAADWAGNPAAAFTAQLYLLNARTLMQLAEQLQADEKTKARVRFAVQQWVDAASPSNFLALNPEALNKAVQTQGESLAAGVQHLLEDLRKGHVSQTDESLFEVGRNVATTAGQVVFENELIQLIEYTPLTPQVHALPILFVPPCINKFYILDLQPENSFIRHSVAQGHRTFVISWRNPDDSLKAMGWDDYITHGPLAAIAAVQEITGSEQINTLGFCVGGTILSTALAVLAARGERLGEPGSPAYRPAASMTLLTTLLDFSDPGILDVFIDESMVRLREMTIGAQAPTGPALLKGKELATTFSFLRPNDLVWNYVVGNYLKGETPPPFDLLYWNGDSTNLPGPMYCWYLRHMYLQNELRKPGALQVCGEQVDLGRIAVPTFIYGSREDHIVPWQSAYASVPLLRGAAPAASGRARKGAKAAVGQVKFVLGASGHIAGVINPPAKGKRSHWVSDALPDSAEDWFAGATEVRGSWWPQWDEWLASHAGPMVAAPKTAGGRRHKPIEPAPGRYVKARA